MKYNTARNRYELVDKYPKQPKQRKQIARVLLNISNQSINKKKDDQFSIDQPPSHKRKSEQKSKR